MAPRKSTKKNDESADRSEEFRQWLVEHHRDYGALKDAVIPIVTNLLTISGIDYLAVTGRTKDIDSAVEKVTRKDYDDPQRQMTDITGIRIVLFFESDVKKVSDLIRTAFRVDEKNSSNTDERMSADQVGYRSVHFVCDLGPIRTGLPEFERLAGLKFEFQVRTVLQHAWAVLAHDNSYKFSGSLPRPLERHLFLLAALLETADQGFDDLSIKIDEYKSAVSQESAKGELDIPIDSISLQSFLAQWASQTGFTFRASDNPTPTTIVRELQQFGINTLADLQKIIPDDYFQKVRNSPPMTMVGHLRTWMLIHDGHRVANDVPHTWHLGQMVVDIIANYHGAEHAEKVAQAIKSSRSHSANAD